MPQRESSRSTNGVFSGGNCCQDGLSLRTSPPRCAPPAATPIPFNMGTFSLAAQKKYSSCFPRCKIARSFLHFLHFVEFKRFAHCCRRCICYRTSCGYGRNLRRLRITLIQLMSKKLVHEFETLANSLKSGDASNQELSITKL